jgi:hypothetical protein
VNLVIFVRAVGRGIVGIEYTSCNLFYKLQKKIEDASISLLEQLFGWPQMKDKANHGEKATVDESIGQSDLS